MFFEKSRGTVKKKKSQTSPRPASSIQLYMINTQEHSFAKKIVMKKAIY